MDRKNKGTVTKQEGRRYSGVKLNYVAQSTEKNNPGKMAQTEPMIEEKKHADTQLERCGGPEYVSQLYSCKNMKNDSN